MVWFNGGPGCSSMLGYLKEIGPYIMDDGESAFKPNPYSWNREANLLFIEAPAGVGYSYCDKDAVCEDFDDFNSSLDNLDAMLSFFKKFPEYAKHKLYLSGESYAGVYVPYLAWRMHQYNGGELEEYQKK